MKNVEHSFKLVALVIIAGVIVAFAAPGRDRPERAPTEPAVHATE